MTDYSIGFPAPLVLEYTLLYMHGPSTPVLRPLIMRTKTRAPAALLLSFLMK